jgi:hypothetical protein
LARTRRWGTVAFACFVAAFATTGSAGAEPYSGSTTSSAPARTAPSIIVDRPTAHDGDQIRVRACGYDPGTNVQFTVDGHNAASAAATTTPARTCDPPFDAARTAGAPYAESAFVLSTGPSTEVAGEHFVCAVASGFPTPCATVSGSGGAQVLALTTSRSNTSILAFTGFALLFWLAMALVAFFLGFTLVRWAKARHDGAGVTS